MVRPVNTAKEIHTIEEFLDAGHNLNGATIQEIDFSNIAINWKSLSLNQTVFLGCTLSNDSKVEILNQGGLVFPEIKDLCYRPYRSHLYDWKELYKESSTGNSIDLDIYNHFSKYKYAPPMMEALLQRVHDHSIDDALHDFLVTNKDGDYEKNCIGIMGGHGTTRTDEYYKKVAHIAQQLTQKGFHILSGGGPGIMEAANLGAYMGSYTSSELDHALTLLSKSDHYTKSGFHKAAMEVLEAYPQGEESLAIPTWFYGHEPSNVFASHIAKYFSNSIREDTLLAICVHGILFAPGSAGTTQEIFMDAAQNHYTTFEYVSPMVFLGKKRYTEDTSLFETITQLSKGKEYSKLLRLVDDVEQTVLAFEELKPYKI